MEIVSNTQKDIVLVEIKITGFLLTPNISDY